MLCPVQPRSRNVAVVACQNFQNVLKVLQAAKKELPDIMQAIEYMDLASMDMVRDMNSTTVYPFDQDYKHYVLVEVAQTVDPYAGSSDSSDYTEVETDRLFNFIETVEDFILVSFSICQAGNFRPVSNFSVAFARTEWCRTMRSNCISYGTSAKVSRTLQSNTVM